MHFKSFALYIPAMGSLGDLQFTPLSDRLPIEVFISIIEHEASDRNLTDLETVRMAMRHLDTKAISSSHLKTGMLSILHFSMQCNNTYSWVHYTTVLIMEPNSVNKGPDSVNQGFNKQELAHQNNSNDTLQPMRQFQYSLFFGISCVILINSNTPTRNSHIGCMWVYRFNCPNLGPKPFAYWVWDP